MKHKVGVDFCQFRKLLETDLNAQLSRAFVDCCCHTKSQLDLASGCWAMAMFALRNLRYVLVYQSWLFMYLWISVFHLKNRHFHPGSYTFLTLLAVHRLALGSWQQFTHGIPMIIVTSCPVKGEQTETPLELAKKRQIARKCKHWMPKADVPRIFPCRKEVLFPE